MRIKENIILQYTLGTFVVISITSITLAVLLAQWMMRQQIANHIDLYPEIVRQKALATEELFHFLEETSSGEVLTERYAQQLCQDLKSFGLIFRVKIWGRDGAILWSDDPAIVGDKFPGNPHYRKAWNGRLNYSVDKPNKLEHSSEAEYSYVLEIYAPIEKNGRVLAVVEIYEAADQLFAQIKKNSRDVYLLVGGAGLFLYVLLFLVFYRAHKRQQNINRQLQKTQDATIFSLASLAETRDPETGAHLLRTQNYLAALATYLRTRPVFQEFLTPANLDLVLKSAPLHDIGKVGVPDHILLKPGKLTPAEFEEMKKHTTYGRDSLRNTETYLGTNSFLRFAEEIVYTHHEKWDGSGYPRGLREHDIPVSGLMMAVADVYDALISKRVYKEAFPHEEAVRILKEGAGSHFCPVVIDAFLAMEQEFISIARQYAD